MADPRALVVGASSAIGRAIATDLARQGGSQLVLWGRDRGRLEETASACRDAGADCRTELVDVTDR